MKVLTCIRPGKMQISSEKYPVLQEGHAIVQVKRVGVCGTDLHAYQGRQPFFSYPRIFGHELAGIIAEIGDNSQGFNKGDIVTVIPYYACGNCIACRNGKSNCCVQIQVLGVHIDGGLQEYLSVPVNYLVQGRGLSYEALAIVEPFSIAAHAVERAAIKPGEFVLLMGVGPIGIAILQLLGAAGAKVIVADTNAHRLNCCKSFVPEAFLINPLNENLMQRLQEITDQDMPTVVVDATGNLNAINNGISYLAHGGRFVLVGLQREMIQISHPEFHKREATLMSSRNATRAHFESVITAIETGIINPQKYITHYVTVEEAVEAFEGWLHPSSNVLKAVIHLDK